MKEVTAAVIIEDCKVLVTRRGPAEKLAGFWEFPGGKVEQGESIFYCLEREILEELSINVVATEEIYRSLYKYEHGEFEIVAIKATIKSGEVSLDVHDKYAWVLGKDILDYEFLPADIPIAEYLLENGFI